MRTDGGQASVELVALLPVLAVVAGAAWQAVVAGQAVWVSGGAARAAARASAVGSDPGAAARRALPPALRGGVRVGRASGGSVSVALAVPSVIGSGTLGTIHAQARFAPQGGERR
jgi:hypothetical protein